MRTRTVFDHGMQNIRIIAKQSQHHIELLNNIMTVH